MSLGGLTLSLCNSAINLYLGGKGNKLKLFFSYPYIRYFMCLLLSGMMGYLVCINWLKLVISEQLVLFGRVDSFGTAYCVLLTTARVV